MKGIPDILNILFIFTTIITVYQFNRAANRSRMVLIIIIAWLAIQGMVALSGFYTVTNTLPPRFMFTVLPPVLLFIVLFLTAGGRRFIDGLQLPQLTLLHTVRVVVELLLLWLFLEKKIPRVMTFEGWNFDVLAGLSAPIVYYLVFVKKTMSRKALLVWNILALLLLLNIVTIAVLSAPFRFQVLGHDQPNIAVLYFPFVWLPCCIVPLVLFSHLAAIRQLTRPETRTNVRANERMKK